MCACVCVAFRLQESVQQHLLALVHDFRGTDITNAVQLAIVPMDYVAQVISVAHINIVLKL